MSRYALSKLKTNSSSLENQSLNHFMISLIVGKIVKCVQNVYFTKHNMASINFTKIAFLKDKVFESFFVIQDNSLNK